MKKVIGLILVLSMVFSLTAMAASNEISVLENHDISIIMDGKEWTFLDAGANQIFPLTYNGTTYLPVRAVSDMVGVNVDWNGKTSTVVLGASNDGNYKISPTIMFNKGEIGPGVEFVWQPDNGPSKNVLATIGTNVKITYKSVVQKLTDIDGNTIYPLVVEGSTYVPVRAVSNILGLDIKWDGTKNSVDISYGTTAGDSASINLFDRPYTGKSDTTTILKNGKLNESGVTMSSTMDYTILMLGESESDKDYIAFDCKGFTGLEYVYTSLAGTGTVYAINPSTGVSIELKRSTGKDMAESIPTDRVMTYEDGSALHKSFGDTLDITGWDSIGFYAVGMDLNSIIYSNLINE